MATDTLETELKYEAEPGWVLPGLVGLPRVASESAAQELQLVAEYFDTEDLRLIRAGITLRRRTGGDDAGWHLKLPVGPDSRRELQLPLGRGARVPAELARLVRVHARGAALRPVARIATTRQQRILLDDAGASLAEVVDDDVSAESMGEVTALSQWREIEVELTGGDRRLLQAADAYLRKSGLRRSGRSAKLQRVLADRLPAAEPPPRLTPDAPAGQVVVAYLRAQADVLKSADPAVRRDEPDSVHQMRVTSRRLRSTLQAYPAVLESEATAHLQAELQWLGQVLGDARDGEVLAAHLEGLLDQLPPELLLGPVRATVTEHFAPRIAAARRAVLRQLDSRRYLALLDELDGLLADPPLTPAAADPASDVLPGQIAKAYRRLRRRIRHARSLPPGEARDAALHSARKAAKRTRYATEVMVAVAGRHAGRLVGRMKKIQSVLGGHQDAVIARATIRDLGLRAHQAGDNAFTFGLLYERDTHAALEFQERAFHVWHRAKRPKYRRWLRG